RQLKRSLRKLREAALTEILRTAVPDRATGKAGFTHEEKRRVRQAYEDLRVQFRTRQATAEKVHGVASQLLPDRALRLERCRQDLEELVRSRMPPSDKAHEALACVLGVHPSTIEKWCRGKTRGQ